MRKVIVGVVFLLILATITIWIRNLDSSTTIQNEVSVFSFGDTASVDHIVLRDENGLVIDLKKGENAWSLNDTFIARPDAIRNLLTTMKKVSVRAPISQQEMNTVLKNIITGHTLVEIYVGEDLVRNYYVGGPDKEHTGTYMLMKGAQRPYLMHIEGFHGFLTPRFFTNTYEWRHRGVFEYKAEEIESVEVNFTDRSDKDFRIERTASGDLEVFAGVDMSPVMAIDSFMLSAYLSNYKMIHYESYEETKSEAFLDSVRSSEPIFHIAVRDLSGQEKKVTAFRKPIKEGYDPEGNEIKYDMDRLYIAIDSEEIVIAQYVILDKLTAGISFFKNR
ncbi:MAG: hypothetical protein HQ500_07835 [Flavobacteriales bacterium]|nr:hypothetical protein [Flavobacteriales bacterium]